MRLTHLQLLQRLARLDADSYAGQDQQHRAEPDLQNKGKAQQHDVRAQRFPLVWR